MHFARYEMERGMIAYFDSIANDGTQNHGFGLHLVGSKGILAIRNDRQPFAYWVPGNPLGPTRESAPGRPSPPPAPERRNQIFKPCRMCIPTLPPPRIWSTPCTIIANRSAIWTKAA